MADIFSKREMENMLMGKHILILGDSNMRALYKDLVWLINQGSLVNAEAIRAKGERSYLGDKLLGSHVMTRARHYVEHREYDHPSSQTRLEFKFITQVLSDETRDMLELFRKNRNRAPSVILINSTLWDLSRWGPNGDKKFRNNLRELFSRLRSNLPCDTVVMWLTALQPAHKIRAKGLIVKQLECIENSLQFQIMEANSYAASVAREFGFDVLDVHYYTRLLGHRRRPDGVHYNRSIVRFLTNLVLTHLAHLWDIKLPGKVSHRDIEYIVQAKSGQVKPPAPAKHKEAHDSKEVQCGEISEAVKTSQRDDDGNNNNNVEERKLLQAKRKTKPSDEDNSAETDQLQSLLNKAVADYMSDEEKDPDEIEDDIENYFGALLQGMTFEPDEEEKVTTGGFDTGFDRPMNEGGRDPSRVEFYEDDIFWDNPPSGEWNNNENDPRRAARQQGGNTDNMSAPAVWEQTTPFDFNPRGTNMPGTNIPGGGNLGNFPPFQGNSHVGEVFQFNAMNNNNNNKASRNLFSSDNENYSMCNNWNKNGFGGNSNGFSGNGFVGNGGFGQFAGYSGFGSGNNSGFAGVNNSGFGGGNNSGFGGGINSGFGGENKSGFGGGNNSGFGGGNNSGFGGGNNSGFFGGNNSGFGGSAGGSFSGIVQQMQQQLIKNTLANALAAQLRNQQRQGRGGGRWI